MTKLPNGWEVKKLEEVCEVSSSNLALKDVKDLDGKYPIYGASGIVAWADFYHKEDEILGIVKDGAGFGRVFILPPKSSVIGTLNYLKNLENTNLKYLYYFLKTIDFSQYVFGAAIPHIYFKNYKNEQIPLPPLEEQRKIVKILDEKFASIDESIRLVKDDLLSLDELWQSILNDSFNPLKSKLDNDTYTLPPTWKWEKLGDISTIVGGGTPSKNNSEFWENGTISWASVRDMNDDFILKTELSITQKGLECSSANLVDDRYVIIATRVGLGKVCLINNPISFNQDLKGVLPSDKLNKIFLFYYFKNIASYLVGMGIGATVKGIKLDVVKQIQIPLPPLKEQERIAKELESKAKTIKELKELYTKRLKDYEELKESLLDLAFKGGL
ncbi:type I restriction/modification system, specificity subunit [Campylobacter sp. RM5004]|uniref:restriction endonuclease subunit S n=1 Tax=Campylobacter sp. RM5004 TaxID=1660078 RepID=UPI001EFBAF49|nr:restriction endonuclease subunit S [Campylobacter sp. RM5004]ULO02142.1 type I restriction/modification system, specificity subunit [Campylobacter sp. RM5004]